MKPIIPPVDKTLLRRELTPDKFLRSTNRGNNEIYIVNYDNSPNVTTEIGRLRELAFREAGGGTGLSFDLDRYDTMPLSYQQLIVWCPREEEILGGYRFIVGEDVRLDHDGKPAIATSELFRFSPLFIKEYLPVMIELGRSFVSTGYQSSKVGSRALYALDNLWDGLGALSVRYSQVRYYFGKVTMYPSYNVQARNMILYFLHKHFPDNDNLVSPIFPLQTDFNAHELSLLFSESDYKNDYRILSREVRGLGFNIPPLINSYMNLSPSMKTFGTSINHHFGEVEETGILISINDIFEEKRLRYITSFKSDDRTMYVPK